MGRSPSPHIGPWTRADMKSFEDLCKDADRLNSEFYPPGLLSPYLARSSYVDVAAARKACKGHPVYGWLSGVMPRAITLASKLSPPTAAGGTREFEFLLVLVEHMREAMKRPGRKSQAGRPTQRRDAASKAIARLLPFIKDGTLDLAKPQAAMLTHLLEVAQSDAMAKRRKTSQHPVLEALAQTLHRRYAITSASIVSDVAAAVGIPCDERTAQRIVKRARCT
jgi:hypothetical protein